MTDSQMTIDNWSELCRLRAEAEGPDGFLTWKNAAILEKIKRVKVEKTIKHLQDILEVVETRFELTPSDRVFLKSLGLQKELIK